MIKVVFWPRHYEHKTKQRLGDTGLVCRTRNVLHERNPGWGGRCHVSLDPLRDQRERGSYIQVKNQMTENKNPKKHKIVWYLFCVFAVAMNIIFPIGLWSLFFSINLLSSFWSTVLLSSQINLGLSSCSLILDLQFKAFLFLQ